MMIRPLLLSSDQPAFDLARLFYAQYSELNFEDDLLDYMRTGFVTIRPKVFLMAKVIEHEGERMWYVRIAVGSLIELLMATPFHLPKICFCRNNRVDQMRIVSLNRLCRIAMRQALIEDRKVKAAA